MESLLRQINGDVQTKEALLKYLTGFFEEEIIRRALQKQSVESLADAILELKKGFDQLNLDYGIKTTPTKPVNEAR
jgi:hypothetical protein